MKLPWAVAILIGVTGITVGAMLLVRRRAPEGSYFADGDRASGVFGVLATGFSVLLGFIVFLAFTSYDTSRAGAEAEARLVAQQLETAQFLPVTVAPVLTGQLVCYARWVAGPEWDAMADGSIGERVNPWGVAMFRTLRGVEPETNAEQAAYGKWLDQTSDREQARQDRVHGAAGVLPGPLWAVLFFISAVIFVYMLFFADRAERALTQAMLMGSVTLVIVSLFLLLQILDKPLRDGVGALRPVAMQRTFTLLDEQVQIAGGSDAVVCDADGRALEATP